MSTNNTKSTQLTKLTPTIEKFNSDKELETYLVDDALKDYSNLFGKDSFEFYPYFDYNVGIGASLTQSFSTTQASSDALTGNSFIANNALVNSSAQTNTAKTDFSQTNTQEKGVDEADLVETDGNYIYQVTGNDLTIVDVRDPKKLSIASETNLKDLGNIQGAYLYKDKLTVISTSSFYPYFNNSFSKNVSFKTFNPTVNVSVFDVSNPKSVVLAEKSKLDGYLLSSRAVGDQVYVVTQANFGLPQPQLIPKEKVSLPKLNPVSTINKPLDISKKTALSNSVSVLDVVSNKFVPLYFYSSQRYETQNEYLTRLKGKVLDEGLPNFTTFDGKGKIVREGLLDNAQNIYKPLKDNPTQLTSVSVFDVDDNQAGPKLSTGIPTNGATEIYSSLNNLYLLEPNAFTDTDILKVNLDKLNLAAVGKAPGQVLNQFSVGENKGFLRIATTTGFGNNSKNNVYVLQQQGQKLDVVGKVEDIAPGERIYSARFQDDYGFLVTFRQVDPFFTLDLSEPTKPKVAGELKLPGFSEYLQVIDNKDTTEVLGIGRENNNLKVSLFDVTDLKNPQEVDSLVFDGLYSSSQAQFDQQAVSYFPEYETLAIPFYSTNLNGPSFQGLRVFDVDPKNGFTTKGDIIHKDGNIQRSLRIGNDLYVISDKRITVHDFNTLGQKSEVLLPNSSSLDPFGVDIVSTPISPIFPNVLGAVA